MPVAGVGYAVFAATMIGLGILGCRRLKTSLDVPSGRIADGRLTSALCGRLQQPVHLSDERLGVSRLLDEHVRAELERPPRALTGSAARNNHDGHAPRGRRASNVRD